MARFARTSPLGPVRYRFGDDSVGTFSFLGCRFGDDSVADACLGAEARRWREG
jgi:hypothetical protein